MTLDSRKAIVGVVVGVLLYIVVIKVFKAKKDDAPAPAQPPITDANIDIAVTAYQSALDAGEPKETLDELNTSLKAEYGLTIAQRETDGKLIVRNNAGNNIKVL